MSLEETLDEVTVSLGGLTIRVSRNSPSRDSAEPSDEASLSSFSGHRSSSRDGGVPRAGSTEASQESLSELGGGSDRR